MKKLFLSLGIAGMAFLSGNASAQIQQGNVMVGANVANFKFTNGFQMNLNPKVGYFIRDNWAVGGDVGLDIASPAGSSATQTNWSVGAFTRYYFNDSEVESLLRHGRFFGEGSVGFGGTNSNQGASTNGVELGIGAGYAYFLTPNVGLEGLLKFKGLAGGGNTNFNGDLFLGVGFQIYLPTSKAKQIIDREK